MEKQKYTEIRSLAKLVSEALGCEISGKAVYRRKPHPDEYDHLPIRCVVLMGGDFKMKEPTIEKRLAEEVCNIWCDENGAVKIELPQNVYEWLHSGKCTAEQCISNCWWRYGYFFGKRPVWTWGGRPAKNIKKNHELRRDMRMIRCYMMQLNGTSPCSADMCKACTTRKCFLSSLEEKRIQRVNCEKEWWYNEIREHRMIHSIRAKLRNEFGRKLTALHICGNSFGEPKKVYVVANGKHSATLYFSRSVWDEIIHADGIFDTGKIFEQGYEMVFAKVKIDPKTKEHIITRELSYTSETTVEDVKNFFMNK